MTTIVPAGRPSIPIAGRPAPAAAHSPGGGPGPSVDPIKLLKKHKWLLMASVVAGLIVGTIGHYVMLAVYPIYSSSILYECFAQETSVKDLGAPPGFKDELERFMSTQVQVLLSDRIVDKTVGDPNLEREAPKWSRRFKSHGTIDTAQAAKELKRNLSAGVAGQSNFIRVSYWWTDPEEVAAVVKLLGRTYERDRKMVGNASIAEKKQLIAQAIADTTDSITKRQRERDRIISDSQTDSLTEEVSSVKGNITKIQDELVKVRNDKEALTVMRDQLEDELKRPSGPKVPDDIRDEVEKEPVIINLKQEVNTLESELNAMKLRYGEHYPDVYRLQTRVDARRTQLNSERERLNMQMFNARLDRYRTNVQSMVAQEESLLKKYEEAQQRAVELTHILAQIKDIDKDIDNQAMSRSRMVEDLKTIEVVTSSGSGQTRVLLFQDAQIPKIVSFPRLAIMLPLGAVLLLGLTSGFVLLKEIVDQRVKTPSDITMMPRMRLLGFVPHASEDPASPAKVETVFRDQPTGILAESFRQLRGTILKRMQAAGHKSLLCVSGMPESGSTSVAVNIAFAMAAAEQRVLLIDANFRRPSLNRVLGLNEAPGLAEVLAGTKTLSDVVQKGGYDNLTFLAAGAPDARQYERLTSSAMSTLLKDAASQYDIILLDVAPAVVSGDAVGLANRCDASMLVVRAMGETRGLVARLRNELSETRAEFLGVVVNAVRSSAGGYLRGNILASHTYQTNGNGKS